jgi:hypothetical protein
MKIFTRNLRTFRRWSLAAAFAGLAVVGLFLAGCVVESVYPFYTPKDITFDPALVGTWVDVKANNDGKEFWQFDRQGHNSYILTLSSTTETNAYDATLFQVSRQTFLDLCSTNRVDNQLPLHYLMKLELTSPSLKFQLLDYKWLTELLEKKPQALRHILVPGGSGNTNNSQLVLTAETAELQAFILKYVNDTNAFTRPDEMKRWK